MSPHAPGIEPVVRCADCGVSSSNDLRGRAEWRYKRVSQLRVVDQCPDCARAESYQHRETKTQ